MTTSIRVPDTISKLSPDDSYPVVEGVDVGGFTDLQKEVNDNTSKIETNITNINNLAKSGKTKVINNVGDSTPDWGNEPHGNYLLVQRAQTKTVTIETPDPTGGVLDGALFTVYNESSAQAVRLIPGDVADNINSGSATNIPPENFTSFVYQLADRNWLRLEGGYIPAARLNIANYIENKLTTDGKLHTEADLEASGFLKGLKVTGDAVSSVQGAKWIHFAGATISSGKTDQAVVTIAPTGGTVDPTKYVLHFQTIPERDQWSTSEGSKYTEVVCVVDVDDNGFVAWYKWDGDKWETYNAQGLIMSDSNGAIPKVIKTAIFGPGFAIQQAGDQEDAALITYAGSSDDGSITLVDPAGDEISGVNKVNLKGIRITETPNIGGMGPHEAEITSGINWHMRAPDAQYGSGLANEVIIMPPLNTYADPNTSGNNAVILEVKPGTYEPIHAPSYLAYLKESVEVVGKLPQGKETDEGAHHKGSIWFDDVIVGGSPYIETRMADKEWGIQEADELDPNVTGGTDYLIAARIHMRGTAPSDGLVRLYLYDKSIDPFSPQGYMKDKDGHYMAVERHYKEGEELGVLDVIGVVNAKGLTEFSVNVMDNMMDDVIELTDRTEGASGILIQALTSEYKTGDALLQFESDTNQNIEFSGHYLGPDRMSLTFVNQRPDPVVDYTDGTNFTTVNGIELVHKGGIKIGVVDGRTVIQDNGTAMADFVFGKIFTAEETRMLRGKQVDVTTISSTKQNAARVYLVKWTGKPDAYTKGIISSWSNENPTFETGWSSSQNFEIVENVLQEDVTTTNAFTVPADAVNYGFIVTPNEGPISPYHLELKEFKADVHTPFVGYSLAAPEMLNELHLVDSKEYARFTQDAQGYASLRYTINNPVEGNPMPVGEKKSGAAEISIDSSVNQVAGSGARGGEGAIVFANEGSAHIETTLALWNEQVSATTTTFWWSTVGPDGSLTKLPDSEQSFTVPAGAKGAKFLWKYDHEFERGAKIAIRAKSDSIDGSFLEAIPGKPMMDTRITYTELEAIGSDDPWGSLDMSQFEHVYTHELDGRIVVKNASSVTIPFVIEPHMYFDVKRAIKIDGNVARPVRSLDYSYNYDTHELKISFGETVTEARVLVGVYV